MNILKTSQQLEAATEKCSGKQTFLKCPEILKDYKSVRYPFLVRLSALNLQLLRKINSTNKVASRI